MKRTLSILLALTLLALSGVVVAEEAPTMEITYTVESSYIVNIPPEISLDVEQEFEISLEEGAIIEPSMKLFVKILETANAAEGEAEFRLYSATADAYIIYEVLVDGQPISVGNSLLEYIPTDQPPKMSVNLLINVPGEDILFAGIYTDILTFQVGIEAINIM